MKPPFARTIAAGLVGTLVMTGVGLYGAPLMGIPAMNPADMLAGKMGGVALLGWMGHLMIGVTLALAYVLFFRTRIPGPAVARGAIFSLVPWMMAQVMVMPMMAMGLFSGSLVLAGGSLIGHLMYGAVVGGMVGASDAVPAPRAAAAVHP